MMALIPIRLWLCTKLNNANGLLCWVLLYLIDSNSQLFAERDTLRERWTEYIRQGVIVEMRQTTSFLFGQCCVGLPPRESQNIVWPVGTLTLTKINLLNSPLCQNESLMNLYLMTDNTQTLSLITACMSLLHSVANLIHPAPHAKQEELERQWNQAHQNNSFPMVGQMRMYQRY